MTTYVFTYNTTTENGLTYSVKADSLEMAANYFRQSVQTATNGGAEFVSLNTVNP